MADDDHEGLEEKRRAELEARRRTRERRIGRLTRKGPPGFFSSPQAAIVSMTVALVAILAFWGGVPRWVLLAIGLGAVVVIVAGTLLTRSKRGR